MRSVIMSIGSELLGGFLTDTNATYLAQDMAAAGIELVGVTQAGDDIDRIMTALSRAVQDADLVVITGGVGPTEDDLTREAIAGFLGEEVEVDPDLLQSVERFFAARGITMPERNAKQAWLIPSAEALPNPVGTAPGWFVRHGDQIIVSMPGVPREMARMWRDQVMPRLGDRLGATSIVSSTVKTIGIGESAAEDLVGDIIHRGHPVVATYAKDDGVHIRITASDPDSTTAQRLVEETKAEILEIFGPHAYGDLDTSLGGAILSHCQRLGTAIRINEAGSAGRLANLLAEESHLTGWFSGSAIDQYADAATRHGLDPDADDTPLTLARLLANPGLNAGNSAVLTVVARIGEPVDGERRAGDIAFCLNVDGEVQERTHHLEATPSEVRRRAALWGSEFLLVSLAQRADRAGV